MAFHKVVGIDLGTTYSAVSVWDGREVVIIPSALGAKTVPSVVGLDPEGKVIVGSPAQNNLVSDPANTIIEVKREMGTYERLPDPQTNDPGAPKRKRFRGREYLPQEISAFILMELKRQAESYIGEPIHDAVITVPAYFKEPQKGATEDAAHMARLNVCQLLNEPTAAAVCFGADKVDDDDRHIYAVYDLGGGTFDVSIISVTRESVSVVGTGGNPQLGGGDFDDRITGHVLQQIRAKYGVDLSQDPIVWQRIKREAEMRKCELAIANAATLNLPWLTPQLSIVSIPLTRTTFEAIIDDLLKESLACLDRAIESAGESYDISPDDIEQVLLVGGSTRIPRVRSMLAEHLGKEERDIRSDFSPDEVVARGAAMVARDCTPKDGYEGEEIVIPLDPTLVEERQAIILQDVTSHTLGILINQSDFFPIIPKDRNIPARESHGGFVNGGRTNEIPVLIFQGENRVAFDNTLIGRLPIYLPEPREEGYYKFEVTFSLDRNGLLSVAIKCLNEELRDQIWRTEVQCDVRATKEQIDQSAAHLMEVMASGAAPVDTGAVPTEIGSLPKPPGVRAAPPAAAGAGLPQEPVAAAVAPPPATATAPPPVPEPYVSAAPAGAGTVPTESGSLPAPPGAGGTSPATGGPSLPQEPVAAEAAPAHMPEPHARPSPEVSVSQPPEDVPEEFKGIARRAHRLLGELSSSPNRDRLLAAYGAFLDAVQAHSADLEMVGDRLEDVYHDCR